MKTRDILAAAILAAAPAAAHAETPAWLRPVHLAVDGQESEKLVIVPIHSGELRATIPAMASVTSNTARSIVIRPAGSGKVTNVSITPGQHVRQGQVMITYTDHTLHELYLQRDQARAALMSARASVAEASIAYQRGRDLSGSTVSAGEVQKRLAARQQADAALAARQADIGTIEHRLTEEFTSVTETIGHGEDSRLISPVNGVVQNLNTAIAADVTAGEAVAVVTDLSTVWIVAQVRPQEAATLAIGGRMTARPAGNEGATPVVAAISTIDGMADPSTGLLRVVSVVDNRSGDLRPGEMLDAQLETTRGVSGIIVPIAALQDIDGHSIVYTPHGKDEFRAHEVRVLLATDDQAVIQSDLKSGDRVVAAGSFALKGTALLADESGG
ncbi:cation efflux protein [Acetobacter indonesiensis NRIC 0313]|uniref:Heavy metal/cation efflux pump CzcB/HlyD n=1 Tax=Acetobacter indonesiensis TaxID=104101 RepID=A0A6N3T7D0_9PROT|nr:efflux RND transporter periplasmic adaptor subunit [Acetobacter indonesiensis]GAN63333.1 heavy metal/cation efflux pump CzcB/HlyD [Acetobacter indonesiensis]GBQ61994.1 cation efflux protein [Acetobacter indonesiensis NRIC 0313]GEN03838.1 RND transporter [Acetobacter indonesiensis]